MATPINPIGQAAFSGPVQFNYYPLLSDGDDIVSRPASIASGGGVFKRGAIVKWDPATGLITAAVAATDCNAIVVNDVDATTAAQTAQVYVGGRFKADAIIWPGALSHALVTENLRIHDMQIESVEFTDGSLVKSAPSEAEAAAAQKQVDLNREAVAKQAAPAPGEDPAAPKSDSPWAYLTPDERDKQPQLAAVHTAEELEGDGDPQAEGKKRPKATPPVQPPAAHAPPPVHTPPKKRDE